MTARQRAADPAHDTLPAILTFLIADIRGYTRFTQAHGDEAAAGLAATFAEIVREGVEARRGRVIELRGDEALAVFASARQALRAAVDLQVTFADETSRRPGLPLTVGIGLDAGEAVPVENGYRGAALNLAARLCSKAGPGEVLASEGVTHLAGAVGGVHVVERGELELKGIGAPVRVLLITSGEQRAERAAAEPSEVIRVSRRDIPPELDAVTPLAAREREARSLRWLWRQARRGPGQVALISGPSGSGKTRLIAEPAALAAADGASTRYVRCSGQRNELRGALDAFSASASASASLVVVDDLEAALPEETERLAAILETETVRPGLVVASFDSRAASNALQQLVLRAADRALHISLGPVDEADVRTIAALYVDGDTAPIPSRAILEASGGLPARIHALASQWASAEASRRLGRNVSLAEAGRRDLRNVEAELASNVIDLQLARERASLYTADVGASGGHPDVSPFKGLASFELDDADFFFGRERLIAELVGRLAGTSFLAVVGPSGSGKSSVVRAGFVPALSAGILPDSQRWIRVVLRPGERPVHELDRAIFAVLPEAVRGALRSSDDPVAAAAGVLPSSERLLVIVDQFEEVFTACRDERERQRFIHTLVAGTAAGRAVVVLVIRADFYGRCAAYPELAALLATNHVLVGPMAADEYRRAIEQPAKRAGLRIEPTLVDALVSEVIDEPGGLPLLSTALLELWHRREGRLIRAEAYRETGGVRGAVGRLAEAAYARLTETQQAITRAILLRLSAGEGDQAVRRRVPLGEFDRVTNEDVSTILAVLTDARLLTVGEGTVEIAHEALLREWPRLREWLEEDRVGRGLREHLIEAAKAWESSGRDPSELYRGARLASALDWTSEHTLELNELEREFLDESRIVSEREAERQRRTNRRLRALLAGVGVLFIASLVAGGLALVLRREAEQAAAIAEQQRAAAERSATVSEAQRLGAEALQRDLDVSLLLARAGVELHDSLETRANMLTALLRSPAATNVWRPLPEGLAAVWRSPDGKHLLVRSFGGLVALVDASTGAVRHRFDCANTARLCAYSGSAVDEVAFADDGSVIALAREPSRLEFFDPATGGALADRLTLFPPASGGVSWAPDGRSVSAAEVGGGAVIVQDARTAKIVRRLSPPRGRTFLDVYQYSDGHLLTLLHDGPLPEDVGAAFAQPVTYAWYRPGAKSPSTLIRRAAGQGHWPFAVSPDLRTFALGRPDGSVTLYDLATGVGRDVKGRHDTAVTGVAFSPDSRLAATASEDRSAKVWDAASGVLRERLIGHNGAVTHVALGQRGGRTTAYTVAADGALIAWDLGGEQRLGRPFTAGSGNDIPFAPTFAVSRDGALFAVTQADGVVVVRDATTLAVVKVLRASDETPSLDVDFSPDGGRLAVAGVGRRIIQVFDTSTWSRIDGWHGPAEEVDGQTNAARAVSFSPDGETLALGTEDARVWLWDTATGRSRGEPLQAPGPVGEVAFGPRSDVIAAATNTAIGSFATVWRVADRALLYTVDVDERPAGALATAVTFSPDADTLATGGGTGEIRFWDAATGAARGRSLVSSADALVSVSYHLSTELLVTADADGNVRLFDGGERAVLGPPLPGVEDAAAGVAFSPDGRRVFVVSQTGKGYVWEATIDAWKAHACRVAGRNLTEDEWKQYLPDRPYAKVCP